MNMLKFDTLITPTIVKWIFYLGVVVSMLTGLVPVLTAKYMGAFGFEVDMTAAVLVGCLLALIGILWLAGVAVIYVLGRLARRAVAGRGSSSPIIASPRPQIGFDDNR